MGPSWINEGAGRTLAMGVLRAVDEGTPAGAMARELALDVLRGAPADGALWVRAVAVLEGGALRMRHAVELAGRVLDAVEHGDAGLPRTREGDEQLIALRSWSDVASQAACGFPSGPPNTDRLADATMPIERSGGAQTLTCATSAGARYVARWFVRNAASQAEAIEIASAATGASADEAQETFALLEARARAGDPVARRVVARAHDELPGRRPYRQWWEEWVASLDTVRSNARRVDVQARLALLGSSAYEVDARERLESMLRSGDVGLTLEGESVRVSLPLTPECMDAADLAGAALFVIARRLPLDAVNPPLGMLMALMDCRHEAPAADDSATMLSNALRGLGIDPRPYLDATTAASRQTRARQARVRKKAQRERKKAGGHRA